MQIEIKLVLIIFEFHQIILFTREIIIKMIYSIFPIMIKVIKEIKKAIYKINF